MNNSINLETCKKCKLCIGVCPCNILDINGKQEIYFIPERESICVQCGQCMAVCKTKSIHVNDYSYTRDFFDLPENTVLYDNFLDFLATRRSIRNFKDRPVSKDLIRRIIDSISFAPYGCAPDEVHISVVNDRITIDSALPLISEFYDNLVNWINNPFTRFMIKQKNDAETFNTINNHIYPIAKLGNYKLENGDRITRNAPALLIFHADKKAEGHTNNALIYSTYVMLAAHSLGLGATMIELVPAAINKVKALKEIFHIPAGHEAVISVILGYPKFNYQRAIKRDRKNVYWVS